MSSLTLGSGRRVRTAARNTFGFLLVQGFTLVLFALLALAALFLSRARFGHSIDGFLDSMGDFF